MYPNDADVAGIFLAFMLLGVIFGLLYELLRFMRCILPAGRVRTNIEDAAFITLAAVVTFIVNILMNGNQLRYFHLLGASVGFAVYIATLGRLISFVNRKICVALRGFLRLLFSPLRRFVVKILQKINHQLSRLYKILTKSIKNVPIHLKSGHDIVYNDNTYKSILKRGEPRNVIKAKIK